MNRSRKRCLKRALQRKNAESLFQHADSAILAYARRLNINTYKHTTSLTQPHILSHNIHHTQTHHCFRIRGVSTYSLGIEDIDDGGQLAGVLTEVDQHNTANLYESCESLHRSHKTYTIHQQ
jgi:hypothetical protein